MSASRACAVQRRRTTLPTPTPRHRRQREPQNASSPARPARQRPSYAPQAHDRQPRRPAVLLQCRRSRGGRRPSPRPAPPLSGVALCRSSSPGRLFLDSIRIDSFQIDGFMNSDGVLLHETDFIAHSLRLMEYYFILIQSPPSVSGSTVILVRCFFNASLAVHTFLPFSSVCRNFIFLIANDLMFFPPPGVVPSWCLIVNQPTNVTSTSHCLWLSPLMSHLLQI